MKTTRPQIMLLTLLCAAAGPVLTQEGDDDAGPGQGSNERADVCAQLHRAAEQAAAPDVLCPRLGNSGGVAKGDFNGDGFGDLAVGSPTEDLGSVVDAGTVTVIYGSANGLVTSGTGIPTIQLWHQDVSAILETADANDKFGDALAAGDFNGDGFSDLAVAVPGDNVVQVIKGSAGGLLDTNNQVIRGSQFFDESGRPLTIRSGLVWGNFNGDTVSGRPIGDLAIEAQEPHLVGVRPDVIMLLGSTQFGLQTGNTTAKVFSFDNADRAGQTPNQTVDLALSSGDFNSDGSSDLAVGVPFADLPLQSGTAPDAGQAFVMFGGATGLTTTGVVTLTQATAGGTPESLDFFGMALAAGNFDGSGDDLAVGSPGEDEFLINGIPSDDGALQVFTAARTFQLNVKQITPGIDQLVLAVGESFGAALAAGDFNGDGAKDLAIGQPGDVVNGATGSGSVTIIYGLTGTGLRPFNAPGTQFLTDAFGPAEAGDHFGASLSAWNFGKGTQADLAVGVPDEGVGVIVAGRKVNKANAGAVSVIYGSATGLSSTGRQTWHQNIANVPDSVETGDRFGAALY